jgi:anaerobic magnesium-protoporphyrin IX monomethyl ester cyclase
MKILFISPIMTRTKTAPPIGLCYLQASLDKAGYNDSKIIDGLPYRKVKNIIKNYKPDIVAISCFTVYRRSSFKMAKLAKKTKPDVKVILGGPHATFMWEQIMKNLDFIDLIVIGEGEITTVELIKALDKGLPLKDVKGIVFRNNGKIVKTEPRPFIENLDDIPFPSYRDIDFDEYAVANPPQFYEKERNAGIISSRGCVFDCNFCSTTKFWSRRWRARSAKNVVDEIEFLNKKYGIKFFVFFDDIFSTDQQRVIDICKDIIRRRLKIKWYSETRVDCTSKEMFEWMKKAGCFMIQFGVESGSPTILKNINKKVTVDQIVNAFKLAQDTGMQAQAFIIVGSPGETNETMEETKKILDVIKPDSLGISIARIFPCTRLFDMAKEKGLVTEDFWLTDMTAPEYTAEHSLRKLVFMRLDVLRHFYRHKGRFAFYKYLFEQFITNPKVLTDHLKVILLNSRTVVD